MDSLKQELSNGHGHKDVPGTGIYVAILSISAVHYIMLVKNVPCS
jgi:hypothetical protein